MVRKPRSGGGGKSPSFDRILCRHIESLQNKNSYASVEELVDHLRSTYPHYARQKLQPFTKCVHKITNISTRENNDAKTPTKKKQGKVDRVEERLRLIEDQHIKRRSRDISNNSSGSSSSLASATSSGNSSEEDVSTSDDAVFGEKLEPEFDLMKSMLRQNYSRNLKELWDDTQEDMELEVVENKCGKKVNLMNGGIKQVGETGSDALIQNHKYDNSRRVGNINSNGPMFKDLGGMSKVIDELMMEVIVPFYHPHLPHMLGVKPTTGILLHGPPGCGKTKLAHAIANETKVPFYKIAATELVSGVSGASEENIRDLFSKAYKTAPSILFIDEIDAIASKKENSQREMEKRIVTQLMVCMDESHRPVKPVGDGAHLVSSDSKPGHVLVIGATNKPDALDPALRRPGRFDREILLGVPDESARVEILLVLTHKLKMEGAFDIVKLARSTPGFVGADLEALANKAGNLAMKRIIDERKTKLLRKEIDDDWWRNTWSQEEIEKLGISMADFEEAAKLVQPSSRREGFSTIPDVKWDDVGGLDLLRQKFIHYILNRLKDPEDYEKFGISSGSGFLLYGPPGCGKTLIAKAAANEAGASFIHIKGPELLSKYVGESELAIRTIFSRARTCSPCILFFDEVDALTTQRGREGGWVVERLLNQLLIELDGAEKRQGVYVIGATNRIEVMDPALLRPGRFGKRLYVPLPNPDERGMILKALGRHRPIDADVDLMVIGRDDACRNFSGADLNALMDEASYLALAEKQASSDRSPGKAWTIKDAHFKLSLLKISPSVSDEEKQYYERTAKMFKAE